MVPKLGQSAAQRSLSLISHAVVASLTLALSREVGAQSVAAGGLHVCLLNDSGVVSCLGSNRFGQLGRKGLPAAPLTEPVSLAIRASAVGAGFRHTCALGERGTVLCWGANDFGQIGQRGSRVVWDPSPVNLPEQAMAIALGDNHSCALGVSGLVYCWGDQWAGAVGTTREGDSVHDPTLVRAEGRRFSKVFARSQRTCAVEATTEALWCWGANRAGEVDGVVGRTRRRPVQTGVRAVGNVLLTRTMTCLVGGVAISCWGSPESSVSLATRPVGAGACPTNPMLGKAQFCFQDPRLVAVNAVSWCRSTEGSGIECSTDVAPTSLVKVERVGMSDRWGCGIWRNVVRCFGEVPADITGR